MIRAAQYLLVIYIESQRNGEPVSSGTFTDRLEASPAKRPDPRPLRSAALVPGLASPR